LAPPTGLSVDEAAIATEELVASAWQASLTDYSKMEAFTTALNARIARSIEDWWRMICMAGVQGVLGERGEVWGIDLDPSMVGRQE
jgi:hypothetical protein